MVSYRLSALLFLSALATSLLPLAASSQTPALINYQGRLLNGTNLVNGSVGLSLRLFDASAAGTLLYEDSNTVTVTDGLYATLIGDGTTFGTLQSALENTNVWVEVAVNDTALTPRERLVSAAYAVKSRATEVFTGAVADGQLSTNVARLNGANQTFSGPVSFTSASNVFAGSFEGNGALVTNLSLQAITVERSSIVYWGISAPSLAAVPTQKVVAIAAGDQFNLALFTNGTVGAWGDNFWGQTNVPAAATGVVAIAAGQNHAVALRANGTVVGWGGVLGFATNVPASATGAVAVAAGSGYCLALKSNGTVVGWGSGAPATVPAAATGLVAIAAGDHHALGLRADGTVLAWGSNSQKQTNVPGTATGVVAIACGSEHSLALRTDGAVVAWGAGTNTTASPHYGQSVVPPAAANAVAIEAGKWHSIAVRADGTVIGWGYNANGEATVPASVFSPSALAAGLNHNLALLSGRIAAPLARLDQPTNAFSGVLFAQSISGNGAGLTSIGGGSIVAGTLSNVHLAGSAITGDKIAAGTLSNTQYAASSVTGDKIADGSISNADVAANTFWSTAGNTGTTTNQFIGTTDDTALDVRVGNKRALRVQPGSGLSSAQSPSLVAGASVNAILAGMWGSVIAGGGAVDDGGPHPNLIEAVYATIGGGASNAILINANASTIVGGRNNTIGSSAMGATIAGGAANRVGSSAFYAFVAGGADNKADGGFSWAGGRSAHAAHGGSYVWSDGVAFTSAAPNQYLVSASGGVGINKNNPSNALDVAGNVSASGTFYGNGSGLANVALLNTGTYPDARLSTNVALLNVAQAFSATQRFASITIRPPTNAQALFISGGRTGNFPHAVAYIENTNTTASGSTLRLVGSGSATDGVLSVSAQNSQGNIARFGNASTWVAQLDYLGNMTALAFNPTSDRNAKENFSPVDAAEVLARVAAMPILRWNFKSDTGTTHIGPMAQDFHAAFGVGPDDKHIATVDADGVALAAIQALARQNAELRSTNAALQKRLDDLAERLRALEAK